MKVSNQNCIFSSQIEPKRSTKRNRVAQNIPEDARSVGTPAVPTGTLSWFGKENNSCPFMKCDDGIWRYVNKRRLTKLRMMQFWSEEFSVCLRRQE